MEHDWMDNIECAVSCAGLEGCDPTIYINPKFGSTRPVFVCEECACELRGREEAEAEESHV